MRSRTDMCTACQLITVRLCNAVTQATTHPEREIEGRTVTKGSLTFL